MKRYIDADALIKDIEHCSYETWGKGVNPTWWAQSVRVKDNIVNLIKEAPTADVVEVRHGYWIERIEKPSWLEDDVEVYYDCSECGTSHWSIMPPYCPECGAKMDGGKEDGT